MPLHVHSQQSLCDTTTVPLWNFAMIWAHLLQWHNLLKFQGCVTAAVLTAAKQLLGFMLPLPCLQHANHPGVEGVCPEA